MIDSVNSAVFPPLLPPGGRVGVIAPSRWPKPEHIAALEAVLQSRGYSVFVHPQCWMKDGVIAGDGAARVAALHEMFADPSIDAIMCARGGAGCLFMLDHLDFELIRRNPKPFIGFSDVTILLQAITKKAGLVTFHGPMANSFARKSNLPQTEVDLFTVIAQGEKQRKLHLGGIDVARPGTAKGRLVGGTMHLMQAAIGTPYDWSGEGAILFLEDCEEPLYKIDRMLEHMRLAGKFKGVRAVLVAEIVGLIDDHSASGDEGVLPYGKSLVEVFKARVPEGIPLAFNVPCGHGAHVTTFPVGADVQITLSDNQLEMTFTA